MVCRSSSDQNKSWRDSSGATYRCNGVLILTKAHDGSIVHISSYDPKTTCPIGQPCKDGATVIANGTYDIVLITATDQAQGGDVSVGKAWSTTCGAQASGWKQVSCNSADVDTLRFFVVGIATWSNGISQKLAIGMDANQRWMASVHQGSKDTGTTATPLTCLTGNSTFQLTLPETSSLVVPPKSGTLLKNPLLVGGVVAGVVVLCVVIYFAVGMHDGHASRNYGRYNYAPRRRP